MNSRDSFGSSSALEPQGKHRTGLLTLLFTDVAGSTQLKAALGDQSGVTLIQSHHTLVRELLGSFAEAEEIGTAGDSFLLVFAKPSDGLRFALQLQHRLRAFNEGRQIKVEDRVGLHMGEVVLEERSGKRDIHGMQVDTCARVMSLAQAGQILMTRPVFDNARQSLKGEELEGVCGLKWLNHGRFELKGVDEPVEICEVRSQETGTIAAPTTSEKARRVESAEGEAVLGWRPAVGQTVPDTQWLLEQRLGEGGFGEVWLGRHQTMKERRVFKFCFRADRVRSLKREMTLFRLIKERIGDHPNIVSLREVYFEEPPFYVEEDYVEGENLADWCAAQGSPNKLPLETKLGIIAQIADALQAAHDAGVIHRDVKPANILVSTPKPAPSTLNPQPLAKLTDFGIGQVISEEAMAGMTRAGFTQTMLSSSSSQTGTQLYMGPELLAGKPASTRSDIYSLGVVLYQFLIGDFSVPITGDWSDNIAEPLLKEDLKHCLAGKPQERFPGAGQLATNLRSWEQRNRQLAERQRLKAQAERRHRMARITAALAAVFLLLALAMGYGLNEARKQQSRAEASLYAANVNLACRMFEENNLGSALELLEQCRPKPGQTDLRGWEWRYLWQQCQSDELFLLRGHSNSVTGLCFSPDGTKLASGGYDRTLRVWDLRTRQPIAVVPQPARLNALAFSPDGKWLATGPSSGNDDVKLWNTASWGTPLELSSAAEKMGVCALAFSPDGRMLATVGAKGSWVWDISSHRQVATFPARYHEFIRKGVAFSPDGRLLAYPRNPHLVCIWDLASGKEVAAMDGHSRGANALAFSPNGRYLASGGWDSTVKIWDVAAQVELTTLTNHTAWVSSLAFSSDSSFLATAGADQRIRLWNTRDWRQTAALKGHRDEVWTLSYSPDGNRLASGDKDGKVLVWSAQPKTGEPDACRLPRDLNRSFSAPDGATFALMYPTGDLAFWKCDPLVEYSRVKVPFPLTNSGAGAISCGGTLVAQALPDRTIRVWESKSGQERARLGPLNETPEQLAFSEDGELLASAGEQMLRVWRFSTGQEIACWTNDLGPMSVAGFPAFTPDSRQLCTGHPSGVACLWALDGSRNRVLFEGHRESIFAMHVSPQKNLVATTSGDGRMKIWERHTGRELLTLKGQLLSLHSVVFSADGSRLVAGTGNGQFKLWETANFRELATLRGPSDGMVVSLSFLKDSDTLVSGTIVGTTWQLEMRLWRTSK